MRQSAWQKDWDYLMKQENDYIRKNRYKKASKLNSILESKIPDGLQNTLDIAFAKAFELIFQKGTGIIEKTYNKDGIEKQYQDSQYSAELYEDRDSLRQFSENAAGSGNKNLVITSVEGVGLGVLGIGLPDIPLFTGVLLKSIYEVALHYGYSYDTETEKFFILKLIQAALSYGPDLVAFDDQINEFIDNNELPENYEQSLQIKGTAGTMSTELLYMKFLQGLPVVGAIGGAYDTVYLQKVLKYAKLKYHRRFLADQKDDFTPILA